MDSNKRVNQPFHTSAHEALICWKYVTRILSKAYIVIKSATCMPLLGQFIFLPFEIIVIINIKGNLHTWV